MPCFVAIFTVSARRGRNCGAVAVGGYANQFHLIVTRQRAVVYGDIFAPGLSPQSPQHRFLPRRAARHYFFQLCNAVFVAVAFNERDFTLTRGNHYLADKVAALKGKQRADKHRYPGYQLVLF